MLTAGPCRGLDDALIGVAQRTQQVDVGVAGGDRHGAASHGGVGVVERSPQAVVGERAEALQRAERGRPHVAGGRREPGLGRRHIAGVAGEGDGAPIDHFFSRSVNVTTIHARPKPVTVATATPITTASPPLATAAHTRRSGPAAW